MKFNNRNLNIGVNVKIGKNVKIGDNTTIYDNVVIEDNTTICNDCIIGEPVGTYYDNSNYVNPTTKIGSNGLIRSHTIIYADSSIGNNFSAGHRVTIREQTIIGDNCRIGTLSDLQGHLKMGNNCWLHSNVHIGQNTEIGSFVFVFPFVVFTNDPHPPSSLTIGSKVGDYSVIAVSSVILPGIKIGQHCLIGAHTLVAKDVMDNQLVIGNPGKVMGDTKLIISKQTGLSHYPWPNNFDRGMPWENINYNDWLKDKEND